MFVMMALEIKNLHVEVDGKEILKGISLKITDGEVHALMGPNGSGKSTLANTLMGHPKHKITKGKILLNEEDITNLSPDKRAKKGLFLSFQHPSEISGVTIQNFLKTSYNNLKDEKLPVFKFKKILQEKAKLLDVDEIFFSRYLNEGFSGGEKKKTEILQLLTLDPKIAILDETDSGLDIDALKIVSNGINQFKNPNKSILIITHYKRILEYIKPDKISIIKDGKIVYEGNSDLIDHLEKKGYDWISKE